VNADNPPSAWPWVPPPDGKVSRHSTIQLGPAADPFAGIRRACGALMVVTSIAHPNQEDACHEPFTDDQLNPEQFIAGLTTSPGRSKVFTEQRRLSQGAYQARLRPTSTRARAAYGKSCITHWPIQPRQARDPPTQTCWRVPSGLHLHPDAAVERTDRRRCVSFARDKDLRGGSSAGCSENVGKRSGGEALPTSVTATKPGGRTRGNSG